MHILRQYNFFILYSNPEEGKIETTFKLIDRKGPPDFRVSYGIRIKEQPGGTRIDVTAEIIGHKGEKSRVQKDEMKSAWWVIKALMKRMGR